jgi:hypothetical protein
VHRLPIAAVALATLAVVLAGCGGSTRPSAATATTFSVDTQVIDGFQTMVDTANRAAAGLGQETASAQDCAAAWATIKGRLTAREPAHAADVDGAVGALQQGAAAHDAVAVATVAATIARDAARYTRLYP